MTGPARKASPLSSHPRVPTVPLRPLGAAGILDGAVRLVRRHARACLTIAVPLALLRAGVGAAASLASASLPVAFSVVLTLAVAGVTGGLLTGLLSPVLAGDLLGEDLTAGQALHRVGWRWVPLVVVVVLSSVTESAALVFSVLGGVALWGLWAVVAPALVVERLGVRRSFGRSLQLVRGAFWRTWGLRALGWLLVAVLGLFVQLPFFVVAALVSHASASHAFVSTSGAAVAITAIGTLVVSAVLAPVASAVDVLLYLDLRMRHEGLDLVLALPPLAPPLAPSSPLSSAAPSW